MGKHVKRLLQFAVKYPGWHSYAKDRATTNAVRCLADMGVLELSTISNQFRLALAARFYGEDTKQEA